MRQTILRILFLIPLFTCNAQQSVKLDYNNFEKQFIDYKPVKNILTSQDDFEYAKMIINETKSAIKNNNKNFILTDYFNILSAFLTLHENEKNIKTAFKKFINQDDSCEYVLAFENEIKNNIKYAVVLNEYRTKLEACKSKNNPKPSFNIDEYCTIYSLDSELVKTMDKVSLNDQKYRTNPTKEMMAKQRILDKENQKIIENLYKKYKTYIGKSLVGKKYNTTMWSVIQHSNIELMEKYLPIIQKAVQNNELEMGPLKMLIDRYYGLKHGYQVFGSQSGFGFKTANEKEQKRIKQKYGIQ